MKRQKQKKSNMVILLISPILALVAFVLTYYLDPLNYSTQSSLAAIPAFLLSVIILIVSHIIAISKEIERASDDSDRIYEAVKNYLHITKIGTPKKAWEYIMERLPVLEYVQNTSFNFGEDQQEQANERLYDASVYQQSATQISRQIERGLTWKDIGDSSAINQFRKIENSVKEGKHPSRYAFKLIEHSEPQINFILLSYKDGSTEVLFNWDFREIPRDPIVLLSRDPEIFTMFAAQFKGLWRIAVSDYDSIATKSTAQK